jgi:hypothetical protein
MCCSTLGEHGEFSTGQQLEPEDIPGDTVVSVRSRLRSHETRTLSGLHVPAGIRCTIMGGATELLDIGTEESDAHKERRPRHR